MLTVIRQKYASSLFAALFISEIGNNIFRIALLFLVYTLTQQSIWVAVTIAIQLVTVVVIGPFLAAHFDTVNRRKVLIVGDLIRFFLIGLIPFLAYQSLLYLLMIVFLNEIVGSIYKPTLYSVLPELFPKRFIDHGNALIDFIHRFTEVAFAGVAGIVIAVIGVSFAFWLDSLTFLISAIILLRLPILSTYKNTTLTIWKKVAEGITFLFQQPTLKIITITVFAAALFGSVEATLGIVLAIKTLDIGSAGFGFMEGIFALGTIVGTMVIPVISSRGIPRLSIFFISLMLFGLGLSSVGLYPTYWWVLGVYLVTGFLNMGFLIPTRTLLQLHTPHHLRTRVISTYSAVVKSAVLAGSLAGAILESKIGVLPIFLFSGMMICLTSGILFTVYLLSPRMPKKTLPI